jgi:uncharacterized repeat protein (TIGR01451 family)
LAVGTAAAGIANFGTLTITNSTLSGNSANFGGGIFNDGTLTITNSIVANSPSGGDCANGAGTFTANGNNLDTDGSCPGFSHPTSDQVNLGPLADNGGPTDTHALLFPSVAIDAGDQSECTANFITTDQRGLLRKAPCDIGAYEFAAGRADLLISKAVNKTSVKQGELLTYTTTVKNFGPDTAVNVVVSDTLSSGTTFIEVSSISKGNFTAPPKGQTGVVTWNIGDMENGDDEEVKIVVKVLVKGKTTITNTATVSSDTVDPNPGTNTASITVSVAPGTTKK